MTSEGMKEYCAKEKSCKFPMAAVLGAAAVVAIILLGGCGFTSTGDLIRDTVKAKGAQAATQGLDNAEYFLCKAAPVGSIKARYFQTAAGAAAYNVFCNTQGQLEVEASIVE